MFASRLEQLLILQERGVPIGSGCSKGTPDFPGDVVVPRDESGAADDS